MVPAASHPKRRHARTGGKRTRIPLAPGVVFPDWSAVASTPAGAAVEAILATFDAKTRWTGMTEAEDRIRRAALTHFAETGHAPSPARLAAVSGIEGTAVRRLLRRLAGRDLVVLDRDGDAILGAYPFTEHITDHRVHFGATVVSAMCAIDALGIGAMLGRDVVIDSRCRACAGAIGIETRGAGTALGPVAPDGAVVWLGTGTGDGCAAETLCPVIAFFCSDAHLASWRAAADGDVPGRRLSMDEALEAGRALFTPMLAPPRRDSAAGKRRTRGTQGENR